MRQRIEPAGELTPWDSAAAFLINILLYPLATIASLGLSLLICGEPLRRVWFLLAVLAFLATSDFLNVTPSQSATSRSSGGRSFLGIAYRWLLVVAFLWALISVSGLQSKFSVQVWVAWALLTPLLLYSSGVAAQRGLRFATASHHARPSNAIIVGLNEVGRLLKRRLRDPSLRIRVLGYFDDGNAPAEKRPPELLGDTSALRSFIAANDVHIVYITWPMTREQRILQLLEILRDSTASIYFVPDISIVNIIQGRVVLVSGIPLVGVCESPFYGIREMPKRSLDVVLSSALLVFGAPILLAIALGVRLSSPGPILFKQRRYGLDGHEFLVYKFRSMRVTDDSNSAFLAATRNDSRVTRFGAFIRRTSLDELPQLFNVLAGTMSLVGPRPHVAAMNEAYRRLISGYMVRYKVRPGITGWAQVNGSRGGNDLESMRRRLELDLEYLKHWSLGLDLVILLRTVVLMWTDRRAY